MIKLNSFVWTLLLALSLPASSAWATGSDVTQLFQQAYDAIMGKPAGQISPASTTDCTTMDSNMGWINQVDSMFCHFKYDLGLTKVGSSTKQINAGGTVVTAHVEITSGCTANNVAGTSTNYDFKINAWICKNTLANCTATTQFSRAISLCDSYTDDGTGLNGTINKGELIEDDSVTDGYTAGSEAKLIVYDLGTTSTSQKAIVKQYGLKNGVSNNFQLRSDISRTDINHVSFAIALNSSDHADPVDTMRIVGSVNRSNNTGCGFAEQAALGGTGTTTTVSTSTSNDAATGTPTSLTRALSSGDWAYTTAAGACTPPNNAAETLTAITAYTVSGLVGTWHGMATNPSSL